MFIMWIRVSSAKGLQCWETTTTSNYDPYHSNKGPEEAGRTSTWYGLYVYGINQWNYG